jgi:hypothetical protein
MTEADCAWSLSFAELETYCWQLPLPDPGDGHAGRLRVGANYPADQQTS